ncbi:MAG: LeuA family protein [Thermoanaerobaculia bacterium]
MTATVRPTESELIYDWNLSRTSARPRFTPVELDDESLRDGLQSPSVRTPSIESKLEIVHLMDALGIDVADVGLPGAGPHVVRDVSRIVQEIATQRLRLRPTCAARTVASDILPIVEISQKYGLPIEVHAFIGSSPIRQYAEDWNLEKILRLTEEAVSLSVREGLPIMYVTEDTTRSHPEDLKRLFLAAIRAGASRVCVCDTVGHATPDGVRALVSWVRDLVDAESPDVKVDWHGHQDRGLGVINSLTALEAGAHRVHGTGLGIGERVGNTPMDQLLVNLQLLGWIDRDLTSLTRYCKVISDSTAVPLTDNYPMVGKDAFRTGTGVHAAAIIKARHKGDEWLADRVYSGVPAAMVGRHQKIEVGPMSGESNVIYWLSERGMEATPDLVAAIFRAAKESDRVLNDEEILEICKEKTSPRSVAVS